jgi:LysR family transcriptional regulator, glycine cleavage system transcriptional activator
VTIIPTMRAVQAFEAVARCGSVTAAAEELCVSPGAISQQIHNIEEALSASLFERRGRSLTLTSWGRMYYERVRVAFDQLRLAQDTLQLARTKPGIVISALPSLAMRWLRPLIQEWRATHPNATIRVIGTDEEAALQNDHIDFRISYGADARKYDHFAELYVDAVVPVCAPTFLAQHPVHTPDDILMGPLIDIEWDIRHSTAPSWSDWAQSVGEPPTKAAGELTFSLSASGLDAAVDGGGFALAQISMIGDDLASGRLVIPIDRRLSMPEAYFLAWDRAALDRPFGSDFRAFLLAAARRQSALSAAREQAPAPARIKKPALKAG